MGLFDFLKKTNWEHLDKNVPEGYFEVQPSFGEGGYCSDDSCDCPNVFIPRPGGYLFISQELVDFRRDARSLDALQEKLHQKLGGKHAFFAAGMITPIFCCEKSARKRGLDLEIAAADAKYWWNSGLVPLRVTPLKSNKH